jgi:hypothetical protein
MYVKNDCYKTLYMVKGFILNILVLSGVSSLKSIINVIYFRVLYILMLFKYHLSLAVSLIPRN